jgi:cytochrome oxidase Cu insertion factor (SCO1/SenC/PrrC family)
VPPSKLPAGILALWLGSTLGWWAFAFVPLPSASPEWVAAARYACFGSMESGLPELHGWILLVLAPVSFLVATFVLWGSEVQRSVLRIARTGLGRSVVAAILLAVVTEGAWVARKLETARTTAAAAAVVNRDDTELPDGYPRQTTVAPTFHLVDQHGATISLERLRGRPVLITFVFAHCQTICPLLVDTLKEGSRGVPSEVLLVTLDPWRDTPSSLAGIAARWALPDNAHVLSSRTASDVLRVAEVYGVPFERDEKSGDITHPGLVFVIDRTGQLTYTFNNPSVTWVREAIGRL